MTTLTFAETRRRLAEIQQLASTDFEGAHSKEDDLHLDFIRLVALTGPSYLSELARLVLSSSDLTFARYAG